MATSKAEDPKVKLYWLNESRAQNVVWILEELKIKYDIEVFHRNKETMFAPPELEKVHALGKSPVIEITPAGSTESIKLAESGFIMQYLSEHFGQGTNLVPRKWKEGQEGKIAGETEEWMRHQYLLYYSEGSWMPVLTVSLIVSSLKSTKVPFLIRPITTTVANRIMAAFVFPNANRHLKFMTNLLETAPGGGGKYLCGDHLTAADILMSYSLIAAKDRIDGMGSWEGGSPRAAYPKVFEYIDRLQAEPGYKRSGDKIREIDGDFKATLGSGNK